MRLRFLVGWLARFAGYSDKENEDWRDVGFTIGWLKLFFDAVRALDIQWLTKVFERLHMQTWIPIWFFPHVILTIWAKNVKLWLVRKDDFVPQRIISINIGFCKSQSFFMIYRGTLSWKSLFRKIRRHNSKWISLWNISAAILATWGADVIRFFLIREW